MSSIVLLNNHKTDFLFSVMKLRHFSPDIRLSNLVKQYWVMDVPEVAHEKEEFLSPLGAVEIIFHLKNPLLRLQENIWIPEKKSFIEGQQSGIIKIKRKESIRTIGITLYPWATISLFKISPAVFTCNNFCVTDIDISLTQLNEKLLALQNENEIPEICDRHFISSFKKNLSYFNQTDVSVIDAFKRTTDVITISELKKDWCYSSRLFEKKFKEIIGVPPGELIRKRRVNNVLKKIFSEDYKSLTKVSYDAGYYDQSHFIKDFQNYFNTSPKFFEKQQLLLKHFI